MEVIALQSYGVELSLIMALVGEVFPMKRSGADDGTRTRDLLITNQLLYQLSYIGLNAERGEHAIHSPSRKL